MRERHSSQVSGEFFCRHCHGPVEARDAGDAFPVCSGCGHRVWRAAGSPRREEFVRPGERAQELFNRMRARVECLETTL